MKIRAAQVGAFEASEGRAFEDRNVARVRQHFPELASWGDDEVRDLVREGARRAAEHGIDDDYDVSLYIGAAAQLGIDFDRSGAHPWAREILESPGVDARTRMARIYLKLTAEAGSPA